MTNRIAIVIACVIPCVIPCVILGACSEDSAPRYLRLSDPAPRIESIPATPAHLVVFWASWCAPCREETPGLLALAADPPEEMSVVLLSHDEDPADVKEYFGKLPDPRLHLRPDADKATARAFGVDTLPAAFLVVDGRLRARFDGPRQWDSAGMRRLLDRLIAAPRGEVP